MDWWWLWILLAGMALFFVWMYVDYRRWAKTLEETTQRARTEQAKRDAREA